MGFDPRSTNGFLAALSIDDFAFIRPHLRNVQFKQSDVLVQVGRPFRQVYLPHNGIISIIVRLADGERVEIAMIGHESMLGAFSTLGDPLSLGEASALLDCEASVLDVKLLQAAINRSIGLSEILVRHGQAVFAQAQQSAACNAVHAVERRLARCLSRVRDLCGSDEFLLTQEVLSEMIGARRNSVSEIAGILQQADLINYSRGRIRILDAEGLKKISCECYAAVKSQYDRLLRQP